MGERKGTKGLELWCRRLTEGYPGVNVVNMTTSWRDGLAFCAIIHHFRPDLIEFSKLNKDDIYHNNELAFRIAERHLGIPALLEPEDMVEFPVPDRLSILTYLSQFYQTFAVRQGKSPARIAAKRAASSPDHGMVSPASTSPPTKVAFPIVGKVRREPCAKCGHPVFIAERLNVGKLLYHRTCFRCARCNSQLTLANYYETENNEFCCETCPDEEKSTANVTDSSVLTRSLSDEEKSASLKKSEDTDDYSAKFETALEHPEDGSLRRSSTLNSTEYTKARSFFISSQVEDSRSDSGSEDEPPDLPKTKPPTIGGENASSDSGFPNSKPITNVNIPCSASNLGRSGHKPEKSHDIVTKDAISAEGNTSSLVKARMRLFETKSDAPNETHSVNNKVPFKNSSSANREVGINNENNSNLHSFKDSISNKDESFDSALTLDDNEEKAIEEPSKKIDDSVMVILDDIAVDKVDETSSIIVISDDSSIPDEKSPIEETNDAVNEETPSIIEISDTVNEETPSVIEISDDLSPKLDESTLETKPVVEETSKDEQPEDTKQTQEEPSLPLEDLTPQTKNLEEFIPQTKNLGDLTHETKDLGDLTSQTKDFADLTPQTKDLGDLTPQTKDLGDLTPQTKDLEEYPDDLNPFGEDEEEEPKKPNSSAMVSLNPFEDDEDEEPAVPSPKPAARKKLKPSPADKDISCIYIERVSVNPFEDDDEEEKSTEAPQPARRKVIAPPRITLNPFWSDDEDKEQDDRPVPKPRISKTSTGVPEPKPRESGLSINSASTFGSITSVSSSQSGQTLRKKKPAPKPPSMMSGTESGQSSITSSPCHSVTHSPRATPKIRKTKKAPPPPTSTPLEGISPAPDFDIILGDDFEKEKSAKDEVNRNRQSQNLNMQSPSSSENSSSLGAPNKSTYGKWKRRKGQAPARPIPQRRTIKALPMVEVRRELEIIEIQQQGLEKQGVRLEQIIREKCEGPNTDPDDSLSPEIEDMVLQLFELVNEKNELFRRQAELMYLRRQQKLEEEHADIEYQIRCLMSQPEANKTDSDKAREEELISRLVEIVERRNEIIECLEMDRVREAEEDDSINNQLNLYTLKKEEDKCIEKKSSKKDKKKHKKEKKLKLKGQKIDADKDIDESETSTSSVKDKKKKKFNIF